MEEKDKVKLLYIAGYGRSGSTVLDILLGRHPQLISVGEFTNLTEWMEEGDPCACGEPVLRCPFWSSVLDGISLDSRNTVSYGYGKIKQFSFFFLRLFGLRLSKKDYEIARFNYDILRRITEGKEAVHVVDSSKSFGRLLALLLSGLFDIKVIHLVRDGRGVAYSRKKHRVFTINRHFDFQVSRPVGYSTRRWVVNNIMVFLSHFLFLRDDYLLIRYEDFGTHPEKVLSRIQEFAGVDYIPTVDEVLGGKSNSLHNIGGNDLRLKPIREINIDNAWVEGLSFKERVMFVLNGGSLVNWLTRKLVKTADDK